MDGTGDKGWYNTLFRFTKKASGKKQKKDICDRKLFGICHECLPLRWQRKSRRPIARTAAKINLILSVRSDY
jgi:hypothetical protein